VIIPFIENSNSNGCISVERLKAIFFVRKNLIEILFGILKMFVLNYQVNNTRVFNEYELV